MAMTDLTMAAWQYDGRTLSTIVSIPFTSLKKTVQIEIVPEQSTLEKTSLLDGKIGKFKRVSKAVTALKAEAARENWWATLPNLVLGAEQTPTKIQYQPNKTEELLNQYETNWSSMLQQIQDHADIRDPVAQQYIRFLSE